MPTHLQMEKSKKRPLGEVVNLPVEKSKKLGESVNSSSPCSCENLNESDIPSATLPGPPENCKVVQLQDWLKCRGLSYKSSATKSTLVSSVRQFISSGITFTFTDPDPNKSHLRKKRAECRHCSSTTASNVQDVTGQVSTKVPTEGWTELTESIPKTFTVVNLVGYMDKSGKTLKDPVTHENKENKTGVFSQTSLEKGYKFFFDNYLHEIECVKETDRCFVRASCYRSQKKHSLPHRILVQIAHTGEVISGKCSCAAGESGICNHILGLLYLLDHTLRRNLLVFPKRGTCTDNPQLWHKARTDGIRSEPLMCSTVIKPSYQKSQFRVTGVQTSLYEARSSNTIGTEKEFTTSARNKLAKINDLFGLCQVYSVTSEEVPTYLGASAPVGSVLSYQCSLSEGNYNVSCSLEEVSKNERMFTRKDLPNITFPEFLLHTAPVFQLNGPTSWLEKIQLSKEQCVKLESLTREQSMCQLWHDSRKLRLTASNFGLVLGRKSQKEKLVEQLLAPKDLSNVPAIKYGNEKEPVAVSEYMKYMLKIGKVIKVEKVGTVVNPHFPWLSASPDRKVLDAECGMGLVEIKCPSKYRDVDPIEPAINDKQFCVQCNNNEFSVRTTHQYYAQIQGQMGVTQTKWCDFVVYTTKGLIIKRVQFDEVYWTEMTKKLTSFYEDVFVPVALKTVKS